ncbi:hypothetical protein [Sphingosinicella sp. BN140058]|uniref:hypothetical protein n=1 Tax=Sphingosinicella sp. BN140058 TaxID=1892855 RepID=UPI0010120665|nr:hypothetical protein [Sphingosinicella sp. BN140058]QAY75872.1 hypothetical protein ETR14_04500 [Sphingosinicella sp. BN140058]
MATGEDDGPGPYAGKASKRSHHGQRRGSDRCDDDALTVLGTENWNGARIVLQQGQYASMPQTPNGSLILSYLNQAKQNNQGELALSSGGGTPQFLPVPALIQMLSLTVNNWQANNIKVTNTSLAPATPIMVQAFGPGIVGAVPGPLPLNQAITLGVTQAAQGTSQPRSMLLRFVASTGNLSIVGIVGGPPSQQGDTNAYVIAINSPTGETGPDTGNPPPPGYYATTGSNRYDFQFNWSSATVYVVNLSPIAAATMSATMIAL